MHLYCHVISSINICNFACVNTEFHLPFYYEYQKKYYDFFSWVQYAFVIFISSSTHPKHMQHMQLNTNMKFPCNLCIHFSLLFIARAVLSMLICISHEICITDYKMITSFLIAFKFFTSIRVKII